MKKIIHLEKIGDKMKTLHICNVNFEWELEARSKLSVKEAFLTHPTFLQLQFLPFLYAKEGDGVVVTHLPPNPPSHLTIHLFDEEVSGYDQIDTWGKSEAIKRWTSLPYYVPEHLRDLTSKVFAFTHSPNLPGSRLLRSKEELEEFLNEPPYPKVIKTSFGLAGRGRWIIHAKEDLPNAAFQEFEKGDFLIGEPWVNREMDFSTQWLLDDEITFLGSTVLENTKWGAYSKTYVGKDIPFLKEHLDAAQVPIHKLFEMGYRGNLGIDAMVYDQKLHPIVEINLRKTMGWLALKLGKSLKYQEGNEGLLPDFLDIGKKITFQKQMNLL